MKVAQLDAESLSSTQQVLSQKSLNCWVPGNLGSLGEALMIVKGKFGLLASIC